MSSSAVTLFTFHRGSVMSSGLVQQSFFEIYIKLSSISVKLFNWTPKFHIGSVAFRRFAPFGPKVRDVQIEFDRFGFIFASQMQISAKRNGRKWAVLIRGRARVRRETDKKITERPWSDPNPISTKTSWEIRHCLSHRIPLFIFRQLKCLVSYMKILAFKLVNLKQSVFAVNHICNLQD